MNLWENIKDSSNLSDSWLNTRQTHKSVEVGEEVGEVDFAGLLRGRGTALEEVGDHQGQSEGARSLAGTLAPEAIGLAVGVRVRIEDDAAAAQRGQRSCREHREAASGHPDDGRSRHILRARSGAGGPHQRAAYHGRLLRLDDGDDGALLGRQGPGAVGGAVGPKQMQAEETVAVGPVGGERLAALEVRREGVGVAQMAAMAVRLVHHHLAFVHTPLVVGLPEDDAVLGRSAQAVQVCHLMHPLGREDARLDEGHTEVVVGAPQAVRQLRVEVARRGGRSGGRRAHRLQTTPGGAQDRRWRVVLDDAEAVHQPLARLAPRHVGRLHHHADVVAMGTAGIAVVVVVGGVEPHARMRVVVGEAAAQAGASAALRPLDAECRRYLGDSNGGDAPQGLMGDSHVLGFARGKFRVREGEFSDQIRTPRKGE